MLHGRVINTRKFRKRQRSSRFRWSNWGLELVNLTSRLQPSIRSTQEFELDNPLDPFLQNLQIGLQLSHVGPPLSFQRIDVPETVLEGVHDLPTPYFVSLGLKIIHRHGSVKFDQLGQMFFGQEMRQRPCLSVRRLNAEA